MGNAFGVDIKQGVLVLEQAYRAENVSLSPEVHQQLFTGFIGDGHAGAAGLD